MTGATSGAEPRGFWKASAPPRTAAAMSAPEPRTPGPSPAPGGDEVSDGAATAANGSGVARAARGEVGCEPATVPGSEPGSGMIPDEPARGMPISPVTRLLRRP